MDRALSDHVDGDQVRVALARDDPYVRGPARGPQEGPGGLEILGRRPGRAPYGHPLAERLRRGAHDERQPALAGLDTRLREAGPEAVRRDDAPQEGGLRFVPWRAEGAQQGRRGDGSTCDFIN